MSLYSLDSQLRSDVAELTNFESIYSTQYDRLEALAEDLRTRGYDATVQSAGAGCSDTAATNSFTLRHRFLRCNPPPSNLDCSPRIVDPSFKEQFNIAWPSPTYRELMKVLPDVFVGTEVCLQSVVETLSWQV